MNRFLAVGFALTLFGAAGSALAQGATKGGSQRQGQAQGLTRASIMGKWCTQAGSYHFTPTQNTITFASDGSQKILTIRRIDVEPDKITVVWVEDAVDNSEANRGKGSHTTFGKFSGNRMTQLSEATDSGGQTPERYFQRCN